MSQQRIHPGDGDPRHGTANGYSNLHCRCPLCREAHRVAYLQKRRRAAQEHTCPNCLGPGGLAADGTCNTCFNYRQRKGQDRPAGPGPCVNCGRLRPRLAQRCTACAAYLRRHGVERPRHLWDKTAPCSNCTGVRRQARAFSGRCGACWGYWRRWGRERPPELWGAHPREDWQPTVPREEAEAAWRERHGVAP